MENDPLELLDARSTAPYFGITPTALHAQRSRGQKPGLLALKINGRLWWRKSDLVAWLDAEADRQHAEPEPSVWGARCPRCGVVKAGR